MLLPEVKDWFSEGEWDVDLMIRMGVITEEHIQHMYDKEHPELVPVRVKK
jgi:hypothetical protein